MTSGKDYLKLHFIVFLWGFSAILGKLISIPAVELVLFRAALAIPGMGIVIFFAKENLRIKFSDLVKLLLIGLLVSVHWISFFGSARIANVSVSLIGFATNSLWAALLEPWFNRTKVKKIELVFGLLVLAGLYIIFSFDFQYTPGLALGIFAGFTAALFSVFNSHMVKRIDARIITFYEMCGVFIGAFLFLPIYKLYGAEHRLLHLNPLPLDWLYIALLAGVCSVYAYTVSVELMKRISVFLFQLTLNLEPLYGIVMAILIFGDQEKMSVNFYLGTFLILCAVLLYPFLKKRSSLIETKGSFQAKD